MTKKGWEDLQPYLPAAMRERLGVAMRDQALTSALQVPSVIADHTMGANFANDTVAPDGARPGSSPEWTREQHLDGHGIDCALLIPLESIFATNLASPDETGPLSRAYTDYFIETWLPVDPRYKLIAGLPPRDPEAAVKEIKRLAGIDGVVGVLLPTDTLLGRPYYYPIYEAAEEAQLMIVTHIGQAAILTNPHSYAGSAQPTYYYIHSTMCEAAMSHLTSLVLSGTTMRFPGLKFVFVEYGFSWLLHLLWRMDTEWLSLHAETPWLVEPPSHYVRESIRLTSQPIDQPDRRGALASVVDMMYGDDLLLFSTDYPHWDNEFPNNALAGLSRETQARLFHENALEAFPKLKGVPALAGAVESIS